MSEEPKFLTVDGNYKSASDIENPDDELVDPGDYWDYITDVKAEGNLTQSELDEEHFDDEFNHTENFEEDLDDEEEDENSDIDDDLLDLLF